MAIELILFGIGLALFSLFHHVHYQIKSENMSMERRIVTHAEYGMGVFLFMFVLPTKDVTQAFVLILISGVLYYVLIKIIHRYLAVSPFDLRYKSPLRT